MHRIVYLLLAAALTSAASASVQQVALDEDGEIVPVEARVAISNAVVATVRVNLAAETAENIMGIAAATTNALDILETALAHRTDYSLVQLYATGLEDAVGDISQEGGSVWFVEDAARGFNIGIDRESDVQNVLVTLYYMFTGNLTTPRIRAKSQLSGEWLDDVPQTPPEVISIGGGTNVYRTVVSCPKSWAADNAFFQATADIKSAVDDGKVFDIYSDSGVTGTFTVTPSSIVTFRIVAGRVVSMSGSGIIVN